jgi:hypothetical protein
MSVWEPVRDEIKNNPVLKKRYGKNIDAGVEALINAVHKNVIPDEGIDPEDWAAIREKVEKAANDSADRRSGDRRGVCPHENMTEQQWNKIYEISQSYYKGTMDRRAAKRRTD